MRGNRTAVFASTKEFGEVACTRSKLRSLFSRHQPWGKESPMERREVVREYWLCRSKLKVRDRALETVGALQKIHRMVSNGLR